MAKGTGSLITLDDLMIHLLRVQVGFVPLVIALYILNMEELLIHFLKMLISYSFSYVFMREFTPYLNRILISSLSQKPNIKFIEYILQLLFSLLTFLVIELTIDKSIYILFILIILIILCGYMIHSIFGNEASPGSKK